jgi:NAD-dependent SIR2 family protein deacetylase
VEIYLSSITASDSLQDFVDGHRRLFVVTGPDAARIPGIPDYRDADGNWKRQQHVAYQAFTGDPATRQLGSNRKYVILSLVRHCA